MLHATLPELEERKIKPVSVLPALRQAQERESATGVAPSATAISRAIDPAFKVKAEQSITSQKAEDVSRKGEREQAFKEVSFEKDLSFRSGAAIARVEAQGSIFKKELTFKEENLERNFALRTMSLEKGLAFREMSLEKRINFKEKSLGRRLTFEEKVFEQKMKIQRDWLELEKDKQEKQFWGSVLGLVAGIGLTIATAGLGAPAAAGAAAGTATTAGLTGATAVKTGLTFAKAKALMSAGFTGMGMGRAISNWE